MRANVRVIALLDDKGKTEVGDMLAQFADERDGDIRTAMLLDVIVREYPLIITVDREVWKRVDRTSKDVCQLRIDVPRAEMSDDTYESLADPEDHIVALVNVLVQNAWESTVEALPA